MKKIIIIVLAVLLLVGGSVGGTLFLTGAFDKVEVVEEEDGVGAEGEEDAEGEGKSSKKKKKNKKGEPLETFYYNFQPEFVVNFGAKSRPKFLMIEVSISTYDEAIPDLLDKHTPALRNELLNTFSVETSEHLSTAEGKKELREKTRLAIQTVMDEHYGDDAIEDVFFTRFVMQ